MRNSSRFHCWKSTPYQEVSRKLLKKYYTIKIYYHNVTQRSLGNYCKQRRYRGIGIAREALEKLVTSGATQGNLGLNSPPHALDQHQKQNDETLDYAKNKKMNTSTWQKGLIVVTNSWAAIKTYSQDVPFALQNLAEAICIYVKKSIYKFLFFLNKLCLLTLFVYFLLKVNIKIEKACARNILKKNDGFPMKLSVKQFLKLE